VTIAVLGIALTSLATTEQFSGKSATDRTQQSIINLAVAGVQYIRKTL
jgi:hypothetical protein